MLDTLDQALSTQSGEVVVPLPGGELHCERVVRRVPGRRLVVRGRWLDTDVHAKLFAGAKAERDAARDASGSQALLQAGVLTPPLLLATRLPEGAGEVLVYKTVAGSDAETRYLELQGDDNARLRLASRLVRAVAAQHRAGLLQRDMYLRNFLDAPEGIHSLDGDGIRRYPAPLRPALAVDNLALLLSKFDVEDDRWLAEHLTNYGDSGMRSVAAQLDLAELSRRVVSHRLRVACQYADRKVFRNCSDVRVIQTQARRLAVWRAVDDADFRRLLNDPDHALESPGAVVLKNGNTCTVFRCPVGSRNVVIKRYNIKGFWHGLGRALRPSRAAVSWANAHRLRMLGIATAMPLALLERRWGPLRRQAYFVLAYDDSPDAEHFFRDASVSQSSKRSAAEAVARLLLKLYRQHLVHGDMKATNVLVDARSRPQLLDLDAMHVCQSRSALHRGHARDLRRWMRNWQDDAEMSALMKEALLTVYGDDGILRTAGIA